jgi:hypothetical protein
MSVIVPRLGNPIVLLVVPSIQYRYLMMINLKAN